MILQSNFTGKFGKIPTWNILVSIGHRIHDKNFGGKKLKVRKVVKPILLNFSVFFPNLLL